MIQVGSSTNLQPIPTYKPLQPRPTEKPLQPRPTEKPLQPIPTYKPTSEKLKEGGQDVLGKFVEEQLKTDPKITKVNKAIQRYISTW